jgi:hypothetical protein
MATVEIRIDETILGEIDPDTLTIGDQMDLEAASSLSQIIEWLIAHTGAERGQIVAALRPLPLPRVWDLVADINTAMGRAIGAPKKTGRR